MAESNERMVTVVSVDGVSFHLPCKAAQGCKMFSNGLQLEDDEGERHEKIEIQKVTSEVLEKVVEFLVHNADDPMANIPDPRVNFSSIPNKFNQIVPAKWYRDYVKDMDLDLLYGVRSAANYLDIEQLYYLTNIWLVFQMIGMSIDQIHEFLRIPKMTKEEEEQAKKDFPWLFEILVDEK
jgi:hypothetical protein